VRSYSYLLRPATVVALFLKREVALISCTPLVPPRERNPTYVQALLAVGPLHSCVHACVPPDQFESHTATSSGKGPQISNRIYRSLTMQISHTVSVAGYEDMRYRSSAGRSV
jgi:hypothetical protein